MEASRLVWWALGILGAVISSSVLAFSAWAAISLVDIGESVAAQDVRWANVRESIGRLRDEVKAASEDRYTSTDARREWDRQRQINESNDRRLRALER